MLWFLVPVRSISWWTDGRTIYDYTRTTTMDDYSYDGVCVDVYLCETVVDLRFFSSSVNYLDF